MIRPGYFPGGYKREKDRVEYLGDDSFWNWFLRHEPFVTQKVERQ